MNNIEVLKRNLLNAQHTPGWLVNTGDLRQLGKTTTIIEIARELCYDFHPSKFYPAGFTPWEVVIAVPNQQMVLHTLEMAQKAGVRNFVVAAPGKLEEILLRMDSVILLVDEGRYIRGLEDVVKSAGARIKAKYGWW